MQYYTSMIVMRVCLADPYVAVPVPGLPQPSWDRCCCHSFFFSGSCFPLKPRKGLQFSLWRVVLRWVTRVAACCGWFWRWRLKNTLVFCLFLIVACRVRCGFSVFLVGRCCVWRRVLSNVLLVLTPCCCSFAGIVGLVCFVEGVLRVTAFCHCVLRVACRS